MANRIQSLFQIFTKSTGGVKTSTAPNSWATINLWRKFFQMKDQEEEELIDEILDELNDKYNVRNVRPIEAPEVIHEREEFVKDGYRRQMGQQSQRPTIFGSTPSSGIGGLSTVGQAVRYHQQTMYGQNTTSSGSATTEPTLQVPEAVCDDFRYLPQ